VSYKKSEDCAKCGKVEIAIKTVKMIEQIEAGSLEQEEKSTRST